MKKLIATLLIGSSLSAMAGISFADGGIGGRGQVLKINNQSQEAVVIYPVQTSATSCFQNNWFASDENFPPMNDGKFKGAILLGNQKELSLSLSWDPNAADCDFQYSDEQKTNFIFKHLNLHNMKWELFPNENIVYRDKEGNQSINPTLFIEKIKP